MSGLSNAQLAAQVSDLLTRWNAREDQVQDWLGGTADGGPEGDGRYPLSDARGITRLIPCPARMSDNAYGPAADALGHRDGAEQARDVATAMADRAEAQRVLVDGAKVAVYAARDLTLQYRDRAANAEANAEVHRQYAEAARLGTASDLLGTTGNREDAEYAAAQAYNHMVDAEAAAALAGNYNPALYATRADGLSQIVGLQSALDARLLTSGFTWAALPGKPATFAPSAHGHTVADVTGLQAALDGKQAAGSYAAAAHGHVIGDVTGLQAALDAKLATSGFTWAALPGKPGTFTPSAHSHVIADTTGLQAALDAKLATSGFTWAALPGKPSTFAPSAHGHAYSEVTGAPAYVQGAADANLRLFDTNGNARLYMHSDTTAQGFLTMNGSNWVARFEAAAASLSASTLTLNGQGVWHAGNFDPASKANASHSHAMSDITGLGSALSDRDAAINAKAASANPTFTGNVVVANGANKLIIHQPNNTLLTLAPSTNDGADWLWNNAFQFDRTAATWRFTGGLTVGGGSVWHSNNFNPADKANAVHSHDWAQVTGKPPILSLVASLDNSTIDSASSNGFTTVGYPGFSKTLLSVDAGGSTGTVQQEFFYTTDRAGFWRVRNRTDNNTWQPWKHVLLHNDATAPLSGTIWTSTNKPNLLSFAYPHAVDWQPGTRGGVYNGGWHGTSGSGDQYVAFGSSTGQLHWTIDGDYYANNGTSKVWHEGDFNYAQAATAYTLAQRNAGGYLVANWFDALGGGMFSSSTGVHFNVGAQNWGASLETTGSNVHLALRTAGGATRGFLYADVSNSVGLLDSGGNWKLQLPDSGSPTVRVDGILQTLWNAANFNPGSKFNVTGGNISGPTTLHRTTTANDTYHLELSRVDSGVGTDPIYVRFHHYNRWYNRIRADNTGFSLVGGADESLVGLKTGALTVGGVATLNGDLVAASGTVWTEGGLIYSGNWWRSTGTTGWYNATYGTGIWSTQGGEVRTYNGSRFHSEGNLSSGGVIISAMDGGFQNAGYGDGRNRIWSFANADSYGLSYMRGSQGWSSMDTISMHFGTATDAGGLHKFRSDGVAAHAGDLYVKGTRLPVFTSSTGSPSGGVDGDIHITY